ncbi:MAG: FAD:protein FMN transferase [Burkholderiales bacterium]
MSAAIGPYTPTMRAAWLCIAACLAAVPAQAARIQDARALMGTVVEIVAEGAHEAALAAAIESAFREMQRLSDMMNHYDPKSVVSAINDAAGARPVAVPPELMEVLAMARAVSRRTGGAFDVTVASIRGWRFRQDDPRLPSAAEVARQLPLVRWQDLELDERAGTAFLARAGMRVDLGGIAKLYILEAGARALERAGVARLLLNGGGDVVARSGGAPWRVGVRDPRAPGELLGVLEVTNGIVASSGDYERYFERGGRRYHHVLDPRTGYPAEGARGVTLLAARLADANGMGVAIMVLGREEGARLVEATPGLEALIVDRRGAPWLSDGMRRRLRSAR